VPLGGLSLASLTEPVSLGIVLGLFLGKPIGVLAAGGALIAVGGAKLPEGTTWSQLAGMAVLCGIGFTMSLFIGSLAFGEGGSELVVANRIGILAGSLTSAFAGYGWLAFATRGGGPAPTPSAPAS
jgi:NhaA family Na+:H+ antiporter